MLSELNIEMSQATIHDLSFIALQQILRDLNVFQILALIDTTVTADNVSNALELMGVVKATAEINTNEGIVLVSTTGENFERILRNFVPSAHTVYISKLAFYSHTQRALCCVQHLQNLRKLVIMHYSEVGVFDVELTNLQFVKIQGGHYFVRGMENLIAMSPNMKELSLLSIYLHYRLPLFLNNARIKNLIIEDCIVHHNVLYQLGIYATPEEVVFINNYYEMPRDGRVHAHREIIDSFGNGGFQSVHRLTISLGTVEFNIFPLTRAQQLQEISFIVDPNFCLLMILTVFDHFESAAKLTIFLRHQTNIEGIKARILQLSPAMINRIEVKPF